MLAGRKPCCGQQDFLALVLLRILGSGAAGSGYQRVAVSYSKGGLEQGDQSNHLPLFPQNNL